MSKGDIANISIEAALAQVHIAFSEHPMPVSATYCPCCHAEEDMQRILHSVPNTLSDEDLNLLFWDAYWTGIDWPSLAYYVPEVMERFAAGRDIEEDMVLWKLLLASHPDANSKIHVQEGMEANEREAISLIIQAVLDEHLHTLSYHSQKESFRELLSFLFFFDWPIAPFLERWKQTTDTAARTNLCLFLIDYILNKGEGNRALKGTYYKAIAPPPINQIALDRLFKPQAVAEYLMENVPYLELIAPEWETGVSAAFDWAVYLMQHPSPVAKAGT